MNELDIRGDLCCGFKDKNEQDFLGVLKIPEGVRRIDKMAFKNHDNFFSQVILPNSLESIGEEAFYGFKFGNPLLSGKQIVFGNGLKNTGEQIVFGNGLKNIEREAFAHIFGLLKITIPDTVVEMGRKTFEYTHLQNVVIGEGINNIPMGAFNTCMINNLTIKNGVKVIEEEAFRCCSLSSLTIPPSVIIIKRKAFESNLKLKNVTIEGKGVDISLDAFNGCMLNTPSEDNIKRARIPVYNTGAGNNSPKKKGLFNKLFR